MSRQLLLDVLPAPAATLGNFLPGANGAALAAARALAPGRAIYFWGEPGCGRSHLLHALAAQAGVAGRYVSAAELVELDEWVGEVPAPRLIAVDDVHRLDDAGQSALFALYNRWREGAGTANTDGPHAPNTPYAFALALAGERAPLALSLREDLRTRLGWDWVFRLTPLSDTDKRAALHRQAHERGLSLRDEVLNWLLTHYTRDMRALASLLDALDRYSLAERRPITLPLLRSMLAETSATSLITS